MRGEISASLPNVLFLSNWGKVNVYVTEVKIEFGRAVAYLEKKKKTQRTFSFLYGLVVGR